MKYFILHTCWRQRKDKVERRRHNLLKVTVSFPTVSHFKRTKLKIFRKSCDLLTVKVKLVVFLVIFKSENIAWNIAITIVGAEILKIKQPHAHCKYPVMIIPSNILWPLNGQRPSAWKMERIASVWRGVFYRSVLITLRFRIIVPPPRLLIFWNFFPREIFIPTPPFY